MSSSPGAQQQPRAAAAAQKHRARMQSAPKRPQPNLAASPGSAEEANNPDQQREVSIASSPVPGPVMFELLTPGAAVAAPLGLPVNRWLACGITIALCMAYIIALVAPFRFPAFRTTHIGGLVVVTGGSSEIGRSAAYAAAERGFTVLVQVQKRDDATSLRTRVKGSSFAHRLKPILVDATDSAVRICRCFF